MAKKKAAPRRVPRSATPRTYGDGRPSQTAPATVEAPANGNPSAGSATAPATQRASVGPARRAASGLAGLTRSQIPLMQEYNYVPKDLGRLGIIAVATFAIMIILGILI